MKRQQIEKIFFLMLLALMLFVAAMPTASAADPQKFTFTWEITDATLDKEFKFQTTVGTNNVRIDWGDKTSPDFYSGLGKTNVPASHTYSTADTYTVTVTALTENDEFINLHIGDQNLAALDVSELTSLTYLYCYNNDLSSLNTAGLTNLIVLSCYENNLKNLNVSGLTSLTHLYCNDNKLESLDVSQSKLDLLHCHNNSLATLDISEVLGTLDWLNAYGQKITLPSAVANGGKLTIANPIEYNGAPVTAINPANLLVSNNIVWTGLSGTNNDAIFEFTQDTGIGSNSEFSGIVIQPWEMDSPSDNSPSDNSNGGSGTGKASISDGRQETSKDQTPSQEQTIPDGNNQTSLPEPDGRQNQDEQNEEKGSGSNTFLLIGIIAMILIGMGVGIYLMRKK